MGPSVESTSREFARFLAYGNQLIEIHIGLRDMLADLREGVVPAAELVPHCLAFCAAVTRHHTGEDTGVFPLLAARHPELRTFLAELERDHQVIAGLLTRVRALAESASTGRAEPGDPATSERIPSAGRAEPGHPTASKRIPSPGRAEPGDPAASKRMSEELDGLAAVLETHFIGEEKRLVAVLNAIDPAEGLTGLTV